MIMEGRLMPQSPVRRFIRQLRDDALTENRSSDLDLLDAYLAHGDEAAFETLVHRHGPMVFGVCCRILRDENDSADAFQATFLVLIRKASSLKSRELLGNWLYGVALRTAMRARAETRKRQLRLRQVDQLPEPLFLPQEPCQDLLEILDREIVKLPEKYRIPVILCELEGRTRQEVAKELRVPLGTLASRLASARKMLACRLARHAPDGSPGVMVLAFGSPVSPIPNALLQATFQNARTIANRAISAGSVSASVVSLTEGVVRSMFLSKLKVVLLLAGIVGLTTIGVGLVRGMADEPKVSDQQIRQNQTQPSGVDESKILTRDAAKNFLPRGPAPLQAWARVSKDNGLFIRQYSVV
jgi:RNA polymerase sigma-70 factor (ECF subfamily)